MNGFPSTFRIPPASGDTTGASGGAATVIQVLVNNRTGSTLTKGTCVFDNGTAVDHSTIAVAALDGTTAGAGSQFLGVLAEAIADGDSGLCTTFGVVTGLDTSGLTSNPQSCDATGQLTSSWGDPLLGVGYVLVTDATVGTFFVLSERESVLLHDHTDASDGGPLGGALRDASIEVTIDGGGVVITAGTELDVQMPWAMTLQSVTLLADQSGSLELDVWKDTYANYPPTIGDTITASALPTLTAAIKSTDAVLTGWTTSLAKGDCVRVHVNSAASITRVLLCLAGVRP